ncbi:unnamed protein product [Zymoseptoria tritici ST99CH_1E4]|uniref:Uncharacterized protein n=1 Tax=Zymoseptoria tritici ST99CH_1E4 TaxID=1276532 RepID=A0A2H1FNP0_ZYMTR|nr:unnamed protein product [Zymoseptoria tritici ST99CH_1E4]
MTAVAAYSISSPFANPTSHPRGLVSESDGVGAVGSIKIPNKRRSGPEKATGFSASMGGPVSRNGERRGEHSGAQSSTWLRRFSNSMSSSRDSSRTPSSRPVSAAFSLSNAPVAVSHSGSTTPIFLDTTPLNSAPNKLVKRASSVHTQSSPVQGSGSKLPILRRPATSHQRSASLHGLSYTSDRNAQPSLSGGCTPNRDTQWRHYFTPRIAAEDVAQSRRSSATAIPNPIKRVYPDRRYIPTLISAKDLTRPADVELDEGGHYIKEDDAAGTEGQAPGSTASSPFPNQIVHFEESAAPRRSFSIGDLLSTGPQPLWKRPKSSAGKSRPWSSRSIRTNRPRVSSDSRASMGNRLSSNSTLESERPAKRRDLTDPETSRRSIYSSPSSVDAATTEHVKEIDLGLGADLQSLHITDVESRAAATSVRSSSQDDLPLESPMIPPTKHTRLSATPSEIPSTVGSDSDTRSVGDNSTDYQSDTFYDSYPTRTTRSSSGRRGPHIETIFDESPPNFSSGRSTKLRDFLSDGQFPGDEYLGHYRHSTIEEEESVVSTPVRSLHNKSVTSTPSARPGGLHIFSSSPPVMNIAADTDELDWDAPEDEQLSYRSLGSQHPSNSHEFRLPADRGLPVRFGPILLSANSSSNVSTPQRNGALLKERANLFDMAEQQPSPSHTANSPPRPRTVHGKKDQDSRWSRPTGRRGPSAMHARSHSVPVVPDVDGKRDTVVANKFGTWGVGSKAVTEDWDEDFEFDPPPLPTQDAVCVDERCIDSGHEMFVPKSIREQQENVVANIGLLREWGLLIEELKELRIRAVGLDMMNGPYAQSWREVDAMIELADQESEEHTLEPGTSPPSSPGFDPHAFEETSPSLNDTILSRQAANDVEATLENTSSRNHHLSTPQAKSVGNRPRKDSELVAQSVIAALQSRTSSTLTRAAPAAGPNKKVPFDTATLRHIVPYVSGLKRLIKDAMRETEKLYSSPRRRSSPEQKIRREAGADGSPAFRNMSEEAGETHDDMTIRRQARQN